MGPQLYGPRSGRYSSDRLVRYAILYAAIDGDAEFQLPRWARFNEMLPRRYYAMTISMESGNNWQKSHNTNLSIAALKSSSPVTLARLYGAYASWSAMQRPSVEIRGNCASPPRVAQRQYLHPLNGSCNTAYSML